MQQLQRLLTELARVPSVICTVGREDSIGELFLRDAPQKVEFSGSWLAIECAGWHLHVNLAAVRRVRFAEVAGHDGVVSPFVNFEDGDGKSVLRFYFPHASQTHITHTAEDLALFARFKERYEKKLGTED
jgi:hypothetical protein